MWAPIVEKGGAGVSEAAFATQLMFSGLEGVRAKESVDEKAVAACVWIGECGRLLDAQRLQAIITGVVHEYETHIVKELADKLDQVVVLQPWLAPEDRSIFDNIAAWLRQHVCTKLQSRLEQEVRVPMGRLTGFAAFVLKMLASFQSPMPAAQTDESKAGFVWGFSSSGVGRGRPGPLARFEEGSKFRRRLGGALSQQCGGVGWGPAHTPEPCRASSRHALLSESELSPAGSASV